MQCRSLLEPIPYQGKKNVREINTSKVNIYTHVPFQWIVCGENGLIGLTVVKPVEMDHGPGTEVKMLPLQMGVWIVLEKQRKLAHVILSHVQVSFYTYRYFQKVILSSKYYDM